MINETTRDFIFKHLRSDTAKLALNPPKNESVDLAVALEQIRSRQKATRKLPHLVKKRNIIFPPSLAVEQASSEPTAEFKSSIAHSGKRFADLTGGFGIDFISISRKFDEAYYVESDERLCGLARHNFEALNLQNVKVVCSTAENFMNQTDLEFDLIFVDPDRRNKQGKKLVRIDDYSPDLRYLQQQIREKSKEAFYKLSPIIDISNALYLLENISNVYAVESQGELKEILLRMEQSFISEEKIYAVNLDTSRKIEMLNWRAQFTFSEPMKYIYEPSPSIMKIGTFNFAVEDFKMKKLASYTHLYTSDELIEDFPGGCYEVLSTHGYNKLHILAALAEPRANIKSRNFLARAEEIKKKLGIKDGGEQYLFAFRNSENKRRVSICLRV